MISEGPKKFQRLDNLWKKITYNAVYSGISKK